MGVRDCRPTVLVVADESASRDRYAAWLSDYRVRTAAGAPGALDELTENVRVVLLDGLAPSPNRTLPERIRERSHDCRIAVITAAEPDPDSRDRCIDAHLTKPMTRDALLDLVETLLARAKYDATIQTLFSLCRRRAALRAADHDLTEAIETLNARIEAVSHDLETTVADFGDTDFRVAFRELAHTSAD